MCNFIGCLGSWGGLHTEYWLTPPDLLISRICLAFSQICLWLPQCLSVEQQGKKKDLFLGFEYLYIRPFLFNSWISFNKMHSFNKIKLLFSPPLFTNSCLELSEKKIKEWVSKKRNNLDNFTEEFKIWRYTKTKKKLIFYLKIAFVVKLSHVFFFLNFYPILYFSQKFVLSTHY